MSDLYFLVQNDDGKWEKADFYDMDNPIEALTKAYQQGRADAIKEFYLKFDDELKRMLNSEFAFSRDKNVLLGVGRMLDMVAEQLKEQSNE